VRTELLQAPGKFFPIRVLGDKTKKIEIALGIADHTGEIINLKQAQITMVILDTLLLELGALFGSQLVRFAFRFGAAGSSLMIFQERLSVVRPLAIGTAGDFHLQQAKIDPEL